MLVSAAVFGLAFVALPASAATQLSDSENVLNSPHYLLRTEPNLSRLCGTAVSPQEKCHRLLTYTTTWLTDATKPEGVLGTQITPENPMGFEVGWLVKNRDYAEVFYVNKDYQLQWIVNEAAALENFGQTWNQKIHEFDSIEGYAYGATIRN